MREFYIFNITNEYKYDIKIDPYFLYKIFEELHNINSYDMKYCVNIYNNITKPINKKYINNKIYNEYKNDESYTKFMNKHQINNYYSNENSVLIIKNSYIKLDTTTYKSSFLKYLQKFKNLFVCDFDNKDYFWLETIA